MTTKLLAWCKSHEDKYRYSAVADASDVQAENAVRANWAAKRSELQAKIGSGPAALQTGPQQVAAHARNSDLSLIDALGKRAQAAHNLKALGIPVPAPGRAGGANAATNCFGGAKLPAVRIANAPPAARKGYRARKQFWGCSRYPSCRGTRN